MGLYVRPVCLPPDGYACCLSYGGIPSLPFPRRIIIFLSLFPPCSGLGTGAPVIESPYGDNVRSEEAPESISRAVASLPPEQMFELMKQMKVWLLFSSLDQGWVTFEFLHCVTCDFGCLIFHYRLWLP